MAAISAVLISTIKELQGFKSLADFVLAGGTNLALRYNHRKSVDIDLMTNKIIGKTGFEDIEKEVLKHYGKKKVIVNHINHEMDEQFHFLRLFIPTGGITIKVELLQNIQYLFPIETVSDIRMLSVDDIGTLKLMSASNRFANKDIYDLDYITDSTNLVKLLEFLKEKSEIFNQDIHRTIFDLDDEKSPIEDTSLLLEFDNPTRKVENKPFHSDDRIDILEGMKSWYEARGSWRSKVRGLYRHLGEEFPSTRPM